MKIAVLDNDILDEAVAKEFHSYGAMFKTLFSYVPHNVSMDVFNTVRGEYPSNINTYDAFLLSGSRADAFGDEPWINTLRTFVNTLIDERKKMIGICFGHQLIAHCLGAEVGRAETGWGMGRMTYQWQHGFADGEFSLLVSHQDQVKTIPHGASVIASSDFCPIAAYTVDNHIICFQGHPEFTPPYMTYLANKRKPLLGEALYQRVIDSIPKGHDGKLVADLCTDFLSKK